MPFVEGKIEFQPGKGGNTLADVRARKETLREVLATNRNLAAFAFNQYLGKEDRSWQEVFPQYAQYGQELQALSLEQFPHAHLAMMDHDGV